MKPTAIVLGLALPAAACSTSSTTSGAGRDGAASVPASVEAGAGETDADAREAEASADESAPRSPDRAPELPYELVENEPMYVVVPRDAIPAIDEPVFVTALEASAWMRPDETVLGVVGEGGTAKCYSAWQLDGHEIVNDVLDGAAIAVTW